MVVHDNYFCEIFTSVSNDFTYIMTTLSTKLVFWINKTSTSSAKDQFFYPMIFVFSSSSEESGSISFELGLSSDDKIMREMLSEPPLSFAKLTMF